MERTIQYTWVSLDLLVNLFTTRRFETKRPNQQLQNKTLQIIKTVKIQQATQNYTTPDDDQKDDRKRLGRTYGTI